MLSQATTRGSTIYKPLLVDSHVGLSCYEPPSVTPGGVLNTNHNSYSQHNISKIIVHNPRLPNQVETIRMSHNSYTHTNTHLPGHNLGSPCVHPPFWATTQGMSFRVTTQGMSFRAITQGMLQQSSFLRYHPKPCRACII